MCTHDGGYLYTPTQPLMFRCPLLSIGCYRCSHPTRVTPYRFIYVRSSVFRAFETHALQPANRHPPSVIKISCMKPVCLEPDTIGRRCVSLVSVRSTDYPSKIHRICSSFTIGRILYGVGSAVTLPIPTHIQLDTTTRLPMKRSRCDASRYHLPGKVLPKAEVMQVCQLGGTASLPNEVDMARARVRVGACSF